MLQCIRVSIASSAKLKLTVAGARGIGEAANKQWANILQRYRLGINIDTHWNNTGSG